MVKSDPILQISRLNELFLWSNHLLSSIEKIRKVKHRHFVLCCLIKEKTVRYITCFEFLNILIYQGLGDHTVCYEILSHDRVTIDRCWIGNWISSTLTGPWLQVTTTVSLIHTVYSSQEHTLKVFSACSVFTRLLVAASNADDPLHQVSWTAPGLATSFSQQKLTTEPQHSYNSLIHQPTTFHQLSTPLTVRLVRSRHGPHRKHFLCCFLRAVAY
jgi:hypothetical protein